MHLIKEILSSSQARTCEKGILLSTWTLNRGYYYLLFLPFNSNYFVLVRKFLSGSAIYFDNIVKSDFKLIASYLDYIFTGKSIITTNWLTSNYFNFSVSPTLIQKEKKKTESCSLIGDCQPQHCIVNSFQIFILSHNRQADDSPKKFYVGWKKYKSPTKARVLKCNLMAMIGGHNKAKAIQTHNFPICNHKNEHHRTKNCQHQAQHIGEHFGPQVSRQSTVHDASRSTEKDRDNKVRAAFDIRQFFHSLFFLGKSGECLQ